MYGSNNEIDWVVLTLIDQSSFANDQRSVFYVVIPILALICLILSFVVSLFLARGFSRYLLSVADKMLGVATLRGQEEQPTAERRRKSALRLRTREIDRMEDALESMESGLNSFTKYVPRDVVRLLQRGKREAVLGVDSTTLTVFFSDIAGFTTITESLQPEDLVDLISQYLHEMSKVILDSSGLVDKFIGDAVMAFWNAPQPLKQHAIVGCQAALRSQQRLGELQDAWTARGFPIVGSRIGLNTGRALVGNLGSPDRLAYTAVGEEVALAATLEELNKSYGTSIMISDSTYALAQQRVLCRPIDRVLHLFWDE